MARGGPVTGSPAGFTLMAKPCGPRCNLRCDYCFYIEKERNYPDRRRMVMSDELLEEYVRQYVAAVETPEVSFAWQGGEPTLAGLPFFRKAVQLQKRYGKGRRVSNSLQTNGVLLDDDWCRFLADHGFLVGLSLDGPRGIHDRHRKDRGGRPTFDRVMKALERLQRHKVELNVLACLDRTSSRHPVEVYRFLRDHGVRFIQLIPVVELEAGGAGGGAPAVTPWSVDPEGYGSFLAGVFDEWVRRDVGRVHVMNFEWTLASLMGMPWGTCVHAPRCGASLVLEHDGDVFSCDHFVGPAHRLGSILRDDLRTLAGSTRQREFGAWKETGLPGACRRCGWLAACHGGCPKHRFAVSPDGEAGMNHLCAGIRRYLEHVAPAMGIMAGLLRRGLPAAGVMARVDPAAPPQGASSGSTRGR